MLGNHVLADFYGCNGKLINNRETVERFMQDAAIHCGATIVNTTIHEFNPIGISGVVVIAESHLAIHTWPEYNFIALDAFTCGTLINPHDAINYLFSRFEAKEKKIHSCPRGDRFEFPVMTVSSQALKVEV